MRGPVARVARLTVVSLLGSSCGACGVPGPSPCSRCGAELVPAGPVRPGPAGLASCSAAFRYEGSARALITALKYRNHRVALPALAAAAAAQVDQPIQVVTWPPTTPARRHQRGFDQAELVARAVAAELGCRARGLLTRRPGPPQTGRSARQRRGGPDFTRRGRARIEGQAILVVDDVITTGATVSAAARVLGGAGAREVHGLALAHTRAPGAGRSGPPVGQRGRISG